jgi:DNA-binding Lrp family transcriptional regulator
MGLLDKLDLEILHILCNNPKQSYRDIAKRLEVSDRTVARRITRMESEGIILGYQPVLSDYAKSLIFNVNEMIEFKFSPAEWGEFERSFRTMYYTAADVIFFYAGKGVGQAMLEEVKEMTGGKPTVEEALTNLSKICVLRGWGGVLFERVGSGAIKAVLNNLRINRFMFRGILTQLLESLTGGSVEISSLTEDSSVIIMKFSEILSEV